MLKRAAQEKSSSITKAKPGVKSSKSVTRPERDVVPQFGQVRTRRLFEEICERVRHEMSIGALKPGDKLPAERELAVQFGVSRTALREALRSLEIAGIVGLQKGMKGGAFILKGDLDLITRSMRDIVNLGRISLDDTTEARTLIMQTAIELVCERAGADIFDALERNNERLALLPQGAAVSDRVKISIEFYALLAKGTGNEMVQIIVESLNAIVLQKIAERYIIAMPSLVAHRRRLISLLRDRDAGASKKEMGMFLKKVHKHLIDEERLNDKRRQKG
jgi:DNA-binding FadR family transcriptional regulator